jgi:hypothetical protein
LKATDLSYVKITITFVSCFISLLERHIKPSVQLETAKKKSRFREERKNEKNNFWELSPTPYKNQLLPEHA